jgi:nitroreductase
MELKEVLLKRRSIRKFKDTPVSDEIINELLHAAMSGPSACNRRPWDFYVVKSEEMLAQVRKATLFGRMNAPLAIIVCGNLTRALPMQLSSYWIQDCSAATENILLEATHLGLGSVWLGVCPNEERMNNLKEIFNLTDDYFAFSIVVIGYPKKEVIKERKYDETLVHYNKLNNKYE